MNLVPARIFAALTLVMLTSGCALYRLEELRQTTPQGTPFQNALARLYMNFASAEEKEYDWWDSAYFAGKGLRAAYGKDVGPEVLAAWKLPRDKVAEMQRARDALVEALKTTAASSNPDMAANAQYNFDCWVEQQEENWQADDIARCRNGLIEALAQLGAPVDLAASTPPVVVPEPAVEAAPKAPEKVTPILAPAESPDKISYVVFFEKDDAVLSDAGKTMVDEVLRTLEPMTGYDVLLSRASGQSSSLYQARAAVVKQRLIDGGVRDTDIVLAGDKRKPARHRIEIFLND